MPPQPFSGSTWANTRKRSARWALTTKAFSPVIVKPPGAGAAIVVKPGRALFGARSLQATAPKRANPSSSAKPARLASICSGVPSSTTAVPKAPGPARPNAAAASAAPSSSSSSTAVSMPSPCPPARSGTVTSPIPISWASLRTSSPTARAFSASRTRGASLLFANSATLSRTRRCSSLGSKSIIRELQGFWESARVGTTSGANQAEGGVDGRVGGVLASRAGAARSRWRPGFGHRVSTIPRRM